MRASSEPFKGRLVKTIQTFLTNEMQAPCNMLSPCQGVQRSNALERVEAGLVVCDVVVAKP